MTSSRPVVGCHPGPPLCQPHPASSLSPRPYRSGSTLSEAFVCTVRMSKTQFPTLSCSCTSHRSRAIYRLEQIVYHNTIVPTRRQRRGTLINTDRPRSDVEKLCATSAKHERQQAITVAPRSPKYHHHSGHRLCRMRPRSATTLSACRDSTSAGEETRRMHTKFLQLCGSRRYFQRRMLPEWASV